MAGAGPLRLLATVSTASSRDYVWSPKRWPYARSAGGSLFPDATASVLSLSAVADEESSGVGSGSRAGRSVPTPNFF